MNTDQLYRRPYTDVQLSSTRVLDLSSLKQYGLSGRGGNSCGWQSLLHGINAFIFENAEGEAVYGRYIIEPVDGNEFLTVEQRENMAPDHLMEELPKRLAVSPAIPYCITDRRRW